MLMLVLLGNSAFADSEDNTEFFMLNFIPQKYWDIAYRTGQRNKAWLYINPLLERNIVIKDEERFLEMIPEIATDEAVQRLKLQIENIIIDRYGSDHLAEIAGFFRTPFGEEMLSIAKDHNLFVELQSQSPQGGPIERWRSYLSPQERAQFSVFTNTPAGKAFVTQTWSIRRSLHYQFWDRYLWPAPPLNSPYIIEIIQADGILKFPNIITRQSLLRELGATNP
ncbi:MAG: hypothetical protein L3J37_07755 [Rhodobacteraceae bacterium]|nr:hypothetical protein [Paracoccaceae bacterium]